jgi:predicted dehydrogenase
MSSIKLGIVGTGGMANWHATQFAKLAGVELAACLDVLPDKAKAFAEKHRIPHTTTDLAELLGRVDAITIVTPDAFHARTCIAALKARKHVLCEKPLTVTLAEAKQVVAAHRKAKGVVGMVNFSYRRSAALQKALALAASGALGELRHVHAHYLQGWLTTMREPKDGIVPWRLQTKTGGGVLGDLGCHILDLTTAVAGQVRKVRCHYGNWPKLHSDGGTWKDWKKQKADANDTAIIELQFANGALGVIHTTRWATGRGNTIRVEAHGTAGALMFDLDRSYEQLDTWDTAGQKWSTETLPAAPDIYERFITSIRTGSNDQPDLARGAQIQALLDACARSAKNGRWETVKK